jgi:hypothetical protein
MSVYERYFLIKQKIEEEEFRYWDATRNGCSIASVTQIEERLKNLKAQFEVLKQLRTKRAVA